MRGCRVRKMTWRPKPRVCWVDVSLAIIDIDLIPCHCLRAPQQPPRRQADEWQPGIQFAGCILAAA